MSRYLLRYIGGCEVVGESYFKDNIAALGSISHDYYWPTERLYEKYVEGDRVYKYHFTEMDAELVPEPDNPHDPNAIRVDVDGKTVGHIAKDNTQRIREVINSGAVVKANVHGGPRKEISETDDGLLVSEKEDYDFRVRLSFYERGAEIVNEPVAQKKVSTKKHTTALLLAIFLGVLGIHRFYVGKVGTGILWLLTAGVFGIGWFVDIVWLLSNAFEDWSGAPVVSEKGQARIAAQGFGAQHNAVCEVFCWAYIVGAVLCVALAVYGALVAQTGVFVGIGICAAIYLGVMTWVISSRGLD